MKLDKSKVADIVALTPTQEGILFHYLYTANYHQYFEQTCLFLEGSLDRSLFENSWHQVIAANEMLRTSFVWEKISKPVQIIWKQSDFMPVYTDLSGWDSASQQLEIDRIKMADKQAGFDLRQVPFRINVIHTDTAHSLMIISAHSILYDGWSAGILLNEFFGSYNASFKDRTAHLPVKTPFKEFVKLLQQTEPEGEQAFWEQYLNGSAYSEMPLKANTAATGSPVFGACTSSITGTAAAALNEICKTLGCNTAALFYTIWGVLLQKLTQESDIVFGTVFSGRSIHLKQIENMVGNFLCTLPLRVQSGTDTSLVSLLYKLADDVKQMQGYEHTELIRIKEYAKLHGNTELFDSLVIFENYPISPSLSDRSEALRITDYTFEHASNYDITLFILQSPDRYELHFAYNHDKFLPDAVQLMANCFVHIAEQFITDIHTPVKSVMLLPDAEQKRIVFDFNDCSASYERDITLHDLLSRAFTEHADRIALCCNDSKLTYRQLDQRCNKIAADMVSRFGTDTRYIGIIADRSVEMVVAVLSVIRAGYAYVPIDPNLPDNRILSMLGNIDIGCVLITADHEEKLSRLAEQGDVVKTVYSLGETDKVIAVSAKESWQNVPPATAEIRPDTSPENVAYVIFTSGSTGLPKGVVIQHRPVINIVEWINKTFNISAEDKVLCVASLGFDLSVYDIFGVLAKGGAVHIATYEDLASPALLAAKLVQEKISIWNSAPPVLQNLIQWCEWNNFANGGKALRLVMLSGDWIALQLPDKIKKYFEAARVVSLGGATEATIWSNYFFVDKVSPDWNSIPYGKPIQNCTYYILDKELHPCPVGIIGDLYIGGECLALGYINDVSLTDRKFIANPFIPGKMYATGDMARWFPDGNMELIGRKDNQVKIRGFRVELGEIEHHLTKIAGIEQALVIANTRPNGDKYLCAYYLSDTEHAQEELKSILSASLPAYMIPLHILRIDDIPTTANGKLDRQKLPLPAENVQAANRQLTPVHKAVMEAWSAILNIPVDSIATDANFFELGGHSLNITELAGRISRLYNINVQIRELFGAPTVDSMVSLIGRYLLQHKHEISQAPDAQYYPLTPAQMRMYTLQETHPGTIAYNITGGARIKGRLDISRVVAAFQVVTNLHQSLRTSFQLVEGQVMQHITTDCPSQIVISDTNGNSPDEEIRSFIRSFDLSQAPLIRVAVITVDAEEHYLILDMHHIISDGFSLRKIIRDFSTAYAGNTLDQPALQYKDYAVYVNQPLYEYALSAQQQYWSKKLAAGITRLKLPLDFDRQSGKGNEGRKVYFKVNGEVFGALQRIAKEQQTTLFTVMLAIFKVLLSKVCHTEDVIVGTPVAGREHHQLADTVGMFVNTLVLKGNPAADKSFAAFLQEEKKTVTDAFINADLPFDHIARQFDRNTPEGMNPVFDVMFEYDDLQLREVDMEGLRVTVIDDLISQAKFDLTFELIVGHDELDCRLEYKVNLFRLETIEWLADRFRYIMDAIIENPDINIGVINISQLAVASAKEQDEQIAFNF